MAALGAPALRRLGSGGSAGRYRPCCAVELSAGSSWRSWWATSPSWAWCGARASAVSIASTASSSGATSSVLGCGPVWLRSCAPSLV
eukprot:3367537-Pyramimonas_sp.AAC.1